MAGAEDGDDYQALAHTQRLKAALHYAVGHVCDELTQEDVASDMTFSKAFVAALNEATYRYVQSSGRDLELFAKHARRSVIKPEDVKLLIRKSPALLRFMEEKSDEITTKPTEKSRTKSKKKQSTTVEQQDSDNGDQQ